MTDQGGIVVTDTYREHYEWLRWRDYREACSDWCAERRSDVAGGARNPASLGCIDRLRTNPPTGKYDLTRRVISRRFHRKVWA